MKITKYLTTSILVFAVLFAQASSVFAAPALQDGTINGTVTGLSCETDEAGATTVLVTVEAEDGTSQTVAVSAETAAALGLVVLDEGGLPDCSEEALGAVVDSALEVEIDPATVIPTEEEDGFQHPVAYALSLFFSDIASYDEIFGAHEEGTGFGVIAQALWMTNKLEGDSSIFQAILEAKETGDYSAFTFEDGTVPTNWGQFKKAVNGTDKHGNLGDVMSGKGDDASEKSNNGHGKGSEKSNNGKGKGKDK